MRVTNYLLTGMILQATLIIVTTRITAQILNKFSMRAVVLSQNGFIFLDLSWGWKSQEMIKHVTCRNTPPTYWGLFLFEKSMSLFRSRNFLKKTSTTWHLQAILSHLLVFVFRLFTIFVSLTILVLQGNYVCLQRYDIPNWDIPRLVGKKHSTKNSLQWPWNHLLHNIGFHAFWKKT